MASSQAESTEVVHLREVLRNKLLNVSANLTHPHYHPGVEDLLLEIDNVTEAIQCLDSFTRIPEDIYDEISSARRLIERKSNVSTRAPQINTNLPGRPSYDISREQLQFLIDVGFNVPQIKDLLHVSTRT